MKKIISIGLVIILLLTSITAFAASDKTNANNAKLISLNKETSAKLTSVNGEFYKIDIKEHGSLTLKLVFEDGNIPFIALYSFDGDSFDKITSENASSGWVGIYDEEPIYTEKQRLEPGTYYINVKWGAGTAFFCERFEILFNSNF